MMEEYQQRGLQPNFTIPGRQRRHISIHGYTMALARVMQSTLVRTRAAVKVNVTKQIHNAANVKQINRDAKLIPDSDK